MCELLLYLSKLINNNIIMKKIILSLVALAMSTALFSQVSYTLDNVVVYDSLFDEELPFDGTYQEGETYRFTINYTADATNVIGAGDFSAFGVREVTSEGVYAGDFEPSLLAFPPIPTDDDGNFLQSGTQIIEYTFADPLPEIADGNLYAIGGYVSSNKASDYVITNNFAIGDDPESLSTNNFSSEELSASYNSATDTVSLISSADYSVYDISGSIVASGSSSKISLAGLVDGVYIIATENGTTKLIKY